MVLLNFIKFTKMGASALHAIISPVFAWRKPWVLQFPDSKVYGANTGPTWGRQDPGEPHCGPVNLAIWDFSISITVVACMK